MDDRMDTLVADGLARHFVNADKSCLDIITDASMVLKQGETVAIVGASGIGKSTLLHMLGTLDRPDAGALFFHGQNVLAYSSRQLAEFRNKAIGFVFQFHHLLPEFTALENVMMPLLIGGKTPKEATPIAEELMVRVGLRDRLDFRVPILSGGEQQRVAIARALVQNPIVLLADEPTGNLDQKNSEEIHDLLMELNKEFQMTMVVVTHNMALANCMKRKVTIQHQRLVEISDPVSLND